MKTVLQILIDHFLWVFDSGFRIVDSASGPGFGGQGSLTLSNGQILLELTSDREGAVLAVCGCAEKFAGIRVTFDLLPGLFAQDLGDTARADQAASDFVRRHLSALNERFAAGDPQDLANRVRELKAARAKRLFG